MFSIKQLIKSFLTYLYNFPQIIKIKHLGRKVFIGNGLQVTSGKGISIGNDVRIGRFCRLSCYPVKDRLGRLQIKDRCYIGNNFSVLTGADVTINEDTLIASNVTIIAENHGMNPECGQKYGLQPLNGASIEIGRNCWIGENVTILPGVSVGDWAILGTSSVVTKDVPPYSIVVGNPAKVLKQYSFKEHKWVRCDG